MLPLLVPADSNQATPPRGRRRHETVSEVLVHLTVGDPEERLTLASLRREFGPRAFGLLILLFALPNLLPVTGIPDLSTFTGAALIFFALQLANVLPASAIALLALALIGRDGLLAVAGYAVASRLGPFRLSP